jgi:glycosyltransferase involved in cell wall biosynthesis
LDKKNHYVVYSFAPVAKKLLSLFSGRATNRVLPKFGFKTIWLPLAGRMDKLDVFLATSQALMSKKVPTLGFVYDVAFLKMPTLYRNATKLTEQTKELIESARHIITISETSKDDISEAFKLHYKQISVFYPGVSRLFGPTGPKYVNITPYFLYVGVVKKTKNIPTLLAAFAQYQKQAPIKHQLIIVGKNELKDETAKLTTKLGITQYVSFKGYVRTSDLPKYYRGALALVTTSFYEGFGLPIVEAMASGIPVIAAKNSAMKEIVGTTGMLVAEDNLEEIVRAMLAVASNKKLATKFKKAGIKKAKLYSWKIFGRGVLDAVYKYCV